MLFDALSLTATFTRVLRCLKNGLHQSDPVGAQSTQVRFRPHFRDVLPIPSESPWGN